jgi:FAD/FMN-containing dehydrogenase
MSDCRSGHVFTNWARTLEFKPRQFCKPRTEAAIVEIVNEARRTHGCVRTQGAGHSFSQLLATNDTLVSLDEMDQNNTYRIDNGTEVSVSAGIRLKDLIVKLKGEGLALKNMGSVTEQSIAGAALTGTHGTGIRLGALPTQILAARMVTGDGNVVMLDKGDPRLKAACLSLGALGIMTKLTLDCVPYYSLDYNVYVGKFDDVMASLDQLVEENVRVLLWWLVPLFGRDDVIIITKNPLGHPPGLLANAESRVPPSLGLPLAPLGKGIDSLLSAVAAQGLGTGGGTFKKIWHMRSGYENVLTLPLLPIFHTECEYAIPAANAAPAMQAFREVVEENDFKIRLPVEVRFTAADDQLLSPCNKGPVCYIGASPEGNTAEVFARFEPLMWRFGGRPHWGKHFTLSRDAIKSMYGANYDAFVAERDAMDPERVFSNSFLTELFG